ncbi:hypothetical protein ASG39_04715 [Rhizobium sp. Leaf371]|uniref:hypothetical protein n=1 Tax=Rhizobium sp. Leaf371 TaxID=1736355 RepID=UPI000712AF67|nr:hypothetical protein [Rhizobium sp. Leaf371]KQS73024.1 hypothetical protein ASG39_04715 [Rhizobium sp. Leaf371]
MKDLTPFYYVDGPMGSGKSYVTEKMIEASDEHSERFVIGTQLTALSEQYAEKLSEEDVSARAVSLKTSPAGVGKSYQKARSDDDLQVTVANQTVVC